GAGNEGRQGRPHLPARRQARLLRGRDGGDEPPAHGRLPQGGAGRAREDDVTAALDRAELRRWALSIVVVLGLHAAGAAVLMTWQDPLVAGEASDAIMVDLAPLATAAIDAPDDIAPGPKQQETEEPPPEPEKTEQKLEEKIEVPP